MKCQSAAWDSFCVSFRLGCMQQIGQDGCVFRKPWSMWPGFLLLRGSLAGLKLGAIERQEKSQIQKIDSVLNSSFTQPSLLLSLLSWSCCVVASLLPAAVYDCTQCAFHSRVGHEVLLYFTSIHIPVTHYAGCIL